MTTSGDTSQISIQQNSSFMDALASVTGQGAPSQDPPLSESVNSNFPVVEESTSLQLYNPVYGGPKEAKDNAKTALVEVSKLLNPDISERSLQVVEAFIDRTSRGSGSSLPMICNGGQCAFLEACPLHLAKSPLPVGARCPVESTLVSLWVNKHLKTLGIADIDEADYSFDMDMLYELAAQELIRYRCGIHLSKNPAIVENKIVSESFNGTPIFADVINPVLDAMEKAGRNISKIRDALLATRKAQVSAGQIIMDNTEKAASLRSHAMALAKARQSKEVIKNAEFKVESPDDESVQ